MKDKRDILDAVERWRLRVGGQVQGVGFRPFVYGLANRVKVGGFVRNDSDGVTIECQGDVENLRQFEKLLKSELPVLAVIDALEVEVIEAVADGADIFEIVSSEDGGYPSAAVTVDTAVCSDCLAEMLDVGDRRYGYGLINCTNCGPRYSIVRRVPYDRPNTTMAGFAMCGDCSQEYGNARDRRFHAQPIACHACGPVVELVDGSGEKIEGDPIAVAAAMLGEGKVLAVKGLGGFHLAVRADDEKAVGRLRELKKRDAKPFALMCSGMDVVRELVEISEEAAGLMMSPSCPIVLAVRREGAKVARGVAEGNHRLGVMLAYTPLQHLLFEKLKGVGVEVVVMTSGNQSDEPLAIGNEEAVERLGGMCEGILWHDRPIERCVDDSVLVDMGVCGNKVAPPHPGPLPEGEGENQNHPSPQPSPKGRGGVVPGNSAAPLPLRRARGFVPRGIRLAVEARGDGICVGGELKTTVAVVKGGEAILSHHIGKLTHPLAFEAYQKSIDDLCEMFGVRPEWIAHDLHPGYLSTGYARRLAERYGAELVGVQHHHAHAAAVMAENGIDGEVLAVICDGVGYAPGSTPGSAPGSAPGSNPGGGPVGETWGGELLQCDLSSYEKLAGLKPILLAGGDAAAIDTRRCALGWLYQSIDEDLGGHEMVKKLFADPQERGLLLQMLKNGVNCVASSAAGRVFDAAAALLDLCTHNDFEAQAAMAMEARSYGVRRQATDGPYYVLEGREPVMIHFAPLVREMLERLTRNVDVGELSALFHDQMAAAFAEVAGDMADRTGLERVVLSGGVFCNQRLTEVLTGLLEERGLRVLRHSVVPANDGGLALGQAAIGSARFRM